MRYRITRLSDDWEPVRAGWLLRPYLRDVCFGAVAAAAVACHASLSS